MTTKTRTALGYTALLVALAAALVLAYGMHQRANAAPVEPTWQQGVVTVNDAATVAAAQQWGAPFAVRYAAQDADVTVKRMDLAGAGNAGGAIMGDAKLKADGDTITGCAMRIDPKHETATVLAHEFGHCLGVAHLYTEKSRSIMVKGGAADKQHGSETVTEIDRRELATLYEGNKA